MRKPKYFSFKFDTYKIYTNGRFITLRKLVIYKLLHKRGFALLGEGLTWMSIQANGKEARRTTEGSPTTTTLKCCTFSPSAPLAVIACCSTFHTSLRCRWHFPSVSFSWMPFLEYHREGDFPNNKFRLIAHWLFDSVIKPPPDIRTEYPENDNERTAEFNRWQAACACRAIYRIPRYIGRTGYCISNHCIVGRRIGLCLGINFNEFGRRLSSMYHYPFKTCWKYLEQALWREVSQGSLFIPNLSN